MAEEVEQLLRRFSNGTMRERHGALRELISLRVHAKASKNPVFRSGVDCIARIAADELSPKEDRLLAVAVLSRLWSTLRNLRSEYRGLISEALKVELPAFQGVIDVDDRAYIGKACALVDYSWIPKYCSYAAVMEESGEMARESFLVALTGSVKRLDFALDYLKEHLSVFTPQTEEPGTTAAIRLKRILSALRNAIIKVAPDTGDKPGESLYDLVKKAFAGVRMSPDEKVMSAVVHEIAAVINEIIRMRFSLATQSSTYKVLSVSRKLIPEYTWEKLAKKSDSLKSVIRAILESVLILAKQGVPADDLVSCLIIAMGNGPKARESLGEMARVPGLSPAIKNWLVNGEYEAPTNVGIQLGESQTINENMAIGDLLVDSLRYRRYIDEQAESGKMELMNSIKPLVNYGLGLCDSIEVLAKRRGLLINDSIGSEIEYTPLEYELVSQSSNIRRVRVVRPSVHQHRKDGLTILVKKGIAG